MRHAKQAEEEMWLERYSYGREKERWLEHAQHRDRRIEKRSLRKYDRIHMGVVIPFFRVISLVEGHVFVPHNEGEEKVTQG
jgi:hypothetical protein